MMLAAEHNYSNTYRECVKMFPDDTACAAFLVRLRWPEGQI
ncbi:MAG: hypothetical protein DDT21_02404 [Syntrophomonadaceae bacterium]|nr:hypothetical protein [Bacillota bacterium]